MGGHQAPIFFGKLSACFFMKDPEQIRETVLQLALPLIEAQGLELWGLDVTPGPTLKVTLYVEAPDDSDATGASIDQCEAISRQLSLAMDVEDCINQPWTLEVSSPGLERKFFTPAQMRPYIDKIIEARLRLPDPATGRKRWLGRLLAVDDAGFGVAPVAISAEGEVRAEGGEQAYLPWDQVARANLVHIFQIPQKPGKASSSRKKK